MPQVNPNRLRKAAIRALVERSVEEADAETIIDHLMTADRWGRHTHGVSVRFGNMLRLAEDGAGERRPEIVRDGGSTVAIDGRDGFGYVAGRFCNELLIERARSLGIATVGLANTTHTGMIGYYADRAARAGLVTLAFADCCPLMAPYGGKRKLLGTNPLTFGFPFEPHPILCDLATSAISYGDLLLAQERGEQLPDGVALDADGEFTRDPAAAGEGALVPFGAHKGGALAVAVQILAGVLTGSAAVPPPGHRYALLLIGIDRGALAGEDTYDEMVRQFADAYNAVPPMEGRRVRLPGTRRFENLHEAEDRPIGISSELAARLGL